MGGTTRVLSAVAIGAAMALAAGAATAAGSPARTIRLVERGGGVRFVDLPPRASHPFDFSPGDLAIVTRNLDDRHGAVVGRLRIACVTITPTAQQCTGTVTLRGGTMEVAGLSGPMPTTTIAVVGGTGAYDGARGTSVARDRAGGGDVADMTIRLRS